MPVQSYPDDPQACIRQASRDIEHWIGILSGDGLTAGDLATAALYIRVAARARRLAREMLPDQHTGRFELRQDEDTGRLYWWGSEDGWKDATEIGVNGVITIDAWQFAVGSVLTLIEPAECDRQLAREQIEGGEQRIGALCKHRRSLFIGLERGPNERRAHAHLCKDCGTFVVSINGERMTFQLCTDEQVAAAGVYAGVLGVGEGG